MIIVKLEDIFYSLVSRLFPRLINSKMKIKALKRANIKIGKKTVFFDAGNIKIDTSRPELLSIGDYCKITSGVVILTHDYSYSVLRRAYGDLVGEARKTVIGNNVFIGMNSIILAGAQIGDDSIVGAGSVVRGIFPPKSVIMGNPAKVIMTLDEYYKKRKEKSPEEARFLAKEHFVHFGEKPTIKEMGAFFPLYLKRDKNELKKRRYELI